MDMKTTIIRKGVTQMERNEGVYIITMIRKSDGVVFFRNPMKTYDYQRAYNEAERSARELSKDYRYVVTELVNILSMEAQDHPVKVTFLT